MFALRTFTNRYFVFYNFKRDVKPNTKKEELIKEVRMEAFNEPTKTHTHACTYIMFVVFIKG